MMLKPDQRREKPQKMMEVGQKVLTIPCQVIIIQMIENRRKAAHPVEHRVYQVKKLKLLHMI